MRGIRMEQNLRWIDRFEISGSTLKLIAIITMFIDHLGAGVVSRYMSAHPAESLYTLYRVMRSIGRIAFPIFCFMLVQGFTYTHSRKKYALRLFLFALLSELPFDLLFKGKYLEFTYQNVMFTLLIGLFTMMGCEWAEHQERLPLWGRRLCMLPMILLGMTIAECMHTDYGAIGVLCIMVLYIYREHRVGQLIAGCVVFLWEVTAPLAFLPIAFYRGKRGRSLKYFFYAFYPVHLLLLYVLCVCIGVAHFPAL